MKPSRPARPAHASAPAPSPVRAMGGRVEPWLDPVPGEPAAPPRVVRPLDPTALRAWPLPQPGEDGDKERRGRVVVVAGGRQCPGAALLAAEAALRAGAGKVMVATAASAATALAVAAPELRVIGLAETGDGDPDAREADRLVPLLEKADVLLVGPGWLAEGNAVALAARLLDAAGDCPVVLDAAAMGAAVGARPPGPAGRLLLPHAGEMAHLTGGDKQAMKADPLDLALDAARQWQALVALKGARTVLAHPEGRAWDHAQGHPGLGTAGSGDVLAGLVAGLAARGASLEQAAAWGIVLHAQAGARVAAREGPLGFLARALAPEVPGLLDELGR